MQHDLHEAQARIQTHRKEGKSLIEKISEVKGFTVGQLFHAKLSYIGATMLQVYEEDIVEQDEAEYK